MRVCTILTAGIVAVATALAATPAAANALHNPEQVRRLDIMLMVTGLRCRTTADNFQADYHRFTARHLGTLNQASDELKQGMARRHGAQAAERALDRLSVTMANTYGQGHPWLSCHELKAVARNLADAEGGEVLEAAAEQLLASRGSAQLALARR